MAPHSTPQPHSSRPTGPSAGPDLLRAGVPRRPALRLGGLLLLGALLGLAACTMTPNAALLSDAEALATATVCGCAPYGSYPHSQPTGTATPTGTWVPPTPTPTFTPTPPPPGCDYCTLVPAPTQTPLSWPPPIITCTPAPDKPTLTPERRDPPPLFPTLPAPTALPALVGNTQPLVLSNLPGEALPGGVAADPHTGQLYVVWSQIDPDFADSLLNGVYLARPSGAGTFDVASVQGPGTYRVYNHPAASTVAVAPDGTVYVAYTRSEGAGDVAYLEERRSTDGGQTWSTPYTFPYTSAPPGLALIGSLRLVVDAAGAPHLAAIAKTGTGGETDPTNGVIDYYEGQADGTWLASRHPVRGNGGRQSGVTLTTFALPDGTIRTVLLWNEDQSVYSAYKDGPQGAWSSPVLLVDGTQPPDGIPDYEPGFASPPSNAMQVITFVYGGQQWVYGFWSLYSTGRLCFVYSQDGGVTWSGEDALGYHPIYHPPLTPDPGSQPANWGSVHWPSPVWDPGQQRLFVVYQYCARDVTPNICFPAVAYSRPGTPGPAWTGYTDPLHPPLRLLRATAALTADTLSITPQALGGSGLVWLTWRGQLSSAETYLAGISPVTLLSGGYQP
jgi:hypothetical protein